jgi:hypothetical protein
MPTIIDPPVGPYSKREEIATWIEALKRMPPDCDVEAAVRDAEWWLRLRDS